ncbi:MAG: hypothetical protein AAF658_22540, partial [Myxococcota bacterium]
PGTVERSRLNARGSPRGTAFGRSGLLPVGLGWRSGGKNRVGIDSDPSPDEVHRRVGEWFTDEEVYGWFERHLPVIAKPSMRHYVRAKELKDAGLDWVNMIGGQFLPPKLLLVAKIKDDPRYASESERVEAFRRMGGGSRATYFNHAKRLRAA